MLFLLFQLGFLCSFGFTEDLKDLSAIELIKLGIDIFPFIPPPEVKPSDVTFYLVTQAQPNESVLITSQNKDLIDGSRKTICVIHGWIENHRRLWYQNIASEYLNTYDINFIEVDWEIPARMPYTDSAKIVEIVGNAVAEFILDSNLSSEDIHIIGHSLGAHVAGFAGKNITKRNGTKLQRITALDPAGPGFTTPNVGPDGRLDKNDATIVVVIHTDAGGFGLGFPIGTLDIYVNGGQRSQPGCIDTDVFPLSFGDILAKTFCSHTMSIKYFVEWINTGKFRCKFCKPVLGVNFLRDRCIFHHQDVVLGSEDISEDINGVCFAKTNNEKPYLS